MRHIDLFPIALLVMVLGFFSLVGGLVWLEMTADTKVKLACIEAGKSLVQASCVRIAP